MRAPARRAHEVGLLLAALAQRRVAVAVVVVPVAITVVNAVAVLGLLLLLLLGVVPAPLLRHHHVTTTPCSRAAVAAAVAVGGTLPRPRRQLPCARGPRSASCKRVPRMTAMTRTAAGGTWTAAVVGMRTRERRWACSMLWRRPTAGAGDGADDVWWW